VALLTHQMVGINLCNLHFQRLAFKLRKVVLILFHN